ncbi:MAG TPA: DUF2726 domain-containing protein [Devosia sp.]|nr:DUF2726 domain-containing protein [Devosia sp.]
MLPSFEDILAVAALAAMVFALIAFIGLSPQSRFRRYNRVPRVAATDLAQFDAVMSATFQRQRLLNGGEYRVFKAIEDELATRRSGYRVFAQTSLGEVLASPSEAAFLAINSKRVDVLIVDRGGWPVLAVEFQGRGHYEGRAAARDAIKREALRRAGVGYLETFSEDAEDAIRSRVCEQLGWSKPAPPAAAVAGRAMS